MQPDRVRFFANTVTFVQSVKKMRQGFSHPMLLSRADSAMYKNKLQIKARDRENGWTNDR